MARSNNAKVDSNENSISKVRSVNFIKYPITSMDKFGSEREY
jgi:hypothetical protein